MFKKEITHDSDDSAEYYRTCNLHHRTLFHEEATISSNFLTKAISFSNQAVNS